MYSAPGDPGKTLFILLDEPESSKGAKLISIYMQLLIFLSSVIFICETLEAIRADPGTLSTFHTVEWVCIMHFTVDYMMRVATCTRRPQVNKELFPYIQQVRCATGSPAFLVRTVLTYAACRARSP